MKKGLFLLGALLLTILFLNLSNKDNDEKLNAEMGTRIQGEIKKDELSQEKINELGGQLKKLFDDIDRDGKLRAYPSLKTLENYLASQVTSREVAKSFVEEYFVLKNGRIVYQSQPELFDYLENRTVTKVEKGMYTVKQKKVLLTFKYIEELNDWRIIGITYI